MRWGHEHYLVSGYLTLLASLLEVDPYSEVASYVVDYMPRTSASIAPAAYSTRTLTSTTSRVSLTLKCTSSFTASRASAATLFRRWMMNQSPMANIGRQQQPCECLSCRPRALSETARQTLIGSTDNLESEKGRYIVICT